MSARIVIGRECAIQNVAVWAVIVCKRCNVGCDRLQTLQCGLWSFVNAVVWAVIVCKRCGVGSNRLQTLRCGRWSIANAAMWKVIDCKRCDVGGDCKRWYRWNFNFLQYAVLYSVMLEVHNDAGRWWRQKRTQVGRYMYVCVCLPGLEETLLPAWNDSRSVRANKSRQHRLADVRTSWCRARHVAACTSRHARHVKQSLCAMRSKTHNSKVNTKTCKTSNWTEIVNKYPIPKYSIYTVQTYLKTPEYIDENTLYSNTCTLLTVCTKHQYVIWQKTPPDQEYMV